MQNKPETYLHAGFFVRLAAYLLDSLIIGAALLVIRIPFWISELDNPNNILVRDLIFSYSVADIVLYLLGVSYFIILTYKTGATIGKRVMHIRVVSVEDRKPTLFEVIYRETVGRFLSELVANVGYFMIGIHKNKQGLHDMLSDTEVIYYHERKVYVELQSEVPKEAGAVNYAAANYSSPNYAAPSYMAANDEVSSYMAGNDEVPSDTNALLNESEEDVSQESNEVEILEVSQESNEEKNDLKDAENAISIFEK